MDRNIFQLAFLPTGFINIALDLLKFGSPCFSPSLSLKLLHFLLITGFSNRALDLLKFGIPCFSPSLALKLLHFLLVDLQRLFSLSLLERVLFDLSIVGEGLVKVLLDSAKLVKWLFLCLLLRWRRASVDHMGRRLICFLLNGWSS